jgi:hypothetical protein
MPIALPLVRGDVRRHSVTGVTVVGVRGHLVAVEAHIGRGLPSLTLTGLLGAAVQGALAWIRPTVESNCVSSGRSAGWSRTVAPATSARRVPTWNCRSRWGTPKFLFPPGVHFALAVLSLTERVARQGVSAWDVVTGLHRDSDTTVVREVLLGEDEIDFVRWRLSTCGPFCPMVRHIDLS